MAQSQGGARNPVADHHHPERLDPATALMSHFGTLLLFWNVCCAVVIGGKADMAETSRKGPATDLAVLASDGRQRPIRTRPAPIDPLGSTREGGPQCRGRSAQSLRCPFLR
jgi:hypothetical protein